MRGTVQNQVDRETRFNNEFDQLVAEPGEELVSVYNRFTQLINDLERNNIIFPKVTVNTKFQNCLQPEWLKYVTQVSLAKRLTNYSYVDLFDYLQQFKKLVRIMQKSQENGQNRTNTDTGTDRVHKSRKFLAKVDRLDSKVALSAQNLLAVSIALSS
ncbi:hypothetical protein Tco_0524766 [Tanacetum coccineum]